MPLRTRARWDCVRPTTLPPAAPPRSQAKARREVAHRRPQQQRRTQTHAPGAPTTRLAPAGAALAGTRPTVPSGTPLPWEALLTRWAQPQSPRGAPGEQGPAAPTLAHGDLEAQGCEEAREAGTAGGGLTPQTFLGHWAGPRPATRVTGGRASGSRLLTAGAGPDLRGHLPPPALVRLAGRVPAASPTCPPRSPRHLARLSLPTALAWQAPDSAERGQGTAWVSRGIRNSRRCWEGRTGEGETGPGDSEQAEAGGLRQDASSRASLSAARGLCTGRTLRPVLLPWPPPSRLFPAGTSPPCKDPHSAFGRAAPGPAPGACTGLSGSPPPTQGSSSLLWTWSRQLCPER